MERRKIIFKAKKLSDGKWVNGDLLHRVNKTYIYNHISMKEVSWLRLRQLTLPPSASSQG